METEIANKTFDDLPRSEQEDFRTVCLDAGLAPDAFTVSYTEDLVGTDDIKVLEREATVSFGCASPAVFKDPKTGQVAQCNASTPGVFAIIVQHEIATCSDAYARMGRVKQ